MTAKTSTDDKTERKNRAARELATSSHEFKRRRCKRLELLLTVPSYTLTLGSVNLRLENRARLQYLLRRLVSRHNWVEASGVLSVILKATYNERSPHCKDVSLRNNRMKYSIAMELHRHMERDPKAYRSKIDGLYKNWTSKIKSYQNRPYKDRYIQLDYVLSFLAQNEHLKNQGQSIAHNPMKSLMLTSGFGRDPMSYLVIGLASYEVWYSALLKLIHQRKSENSCIPLQSETEGDNSTRMSTDLREEDAASVNETCANLQHYSGTSVAFHKGCHTDFNQNPNGESFRADANPALEHYQQFQQQGFARKSMETTEGTDDSTGEKYNKRYSSAFNLHGFPTLLPLKKPFPEDMLNFNNHNRMYYEDAVKYLKHALDGPPPVSTAALLPLIQLLVFDDQIEKAFVTVKLFCKESGSALPFRLRARLQQCVSDKHNNLLSSSFEDVIKKDPTCKHSLSRLMNLYQRGDYDHERLVEMIALHLEATYGDHVTWREFASCLLRLSHCEEDRLSTTSNGQLDMNELRPTHIVSRVPTIFVEGMSGKTWKLRCKWWLNRHFRTHSMKSEVEKGDWNLMAYKAACASHLYGKDFEYVVKVYECVKEHDSTLLSFLRTHMDNSLGYFSNLVKR